MSWTTIQTAVSGTIIIADFWNTQVVGNLNGSETGVATNIGTGIFFATALNTLSSQNQGGPSYEYASTVMNDAATAPENHSIGVFAFIYSTATQNYPGSTSTTVTFDTVDFDTESMANLSTHNERLTCQITGMYICGGTVSILEDGVLYLEIYNSGNSLRDVYSASTINSGSSLYDSTACVALVQLNIGDYINLVFKNNSSSSGTGSTTDGRCCKNIFMKMVNS